MKILYISPLAAYDTVGHAGGQTHNFYMKHMAKEPNVSVRMLCFCPKADLDKLDGAAYGIKEDVCIWPEAPYIYWMGIWNINSIINPMSKYCRMITKGHIRILLKKLEKIRDSGYEPDIIELEYTPMALAADEVRKIYPRAKLVASEHDVTWLGKRREAKLERRPFFREDKRLLAKNTYRRERSALLSCDLAITHNKKDDRLLARAGIPTDKRHVIVPFYHQSELPRVEQGDASKYRSCGVRETDILFFGQMNRPVNEQAACWFMERVLPLLKDLPCRFVILGGGPTDRLKRTAEAYGKRVLVTGFVPEVDPWFAGGMCFAAPLQLGAGIKVKVLETLYAGIPVLTNRIGIEGIPAKNGREYFHCENAQDYADVIRGLYEGRIRKGAVNGKRLVERSFDLEASFVAYRRRLTSLCDRNA